MQLSTIAAGSKRSRLAQRALELFLRAPGRLKRAWHAYWRERAERHLDAWFIEHRNERERYLGRARDVYELERLERAFERRETWGMRL